MQRNLFLFALLTAAVMTLNQTAFVNAEPFEGGQQLQYEIVETRPLPPNTGRVILGGKTSTSAGYVRIAMGMRELPGNRKMEDRIQVFDENGNVVHEKQFELRTIGQQGTPDSFEAFASSVRSTSKHGNYYELRTINRQVTKERNGLFLYEIFDSNGNKLWEDESEILYDEKDPRFAISHIDGSGLKLEGGGVGTITFFSSNGTKIKEIKEIEGYEIGNGFSAVYSEDGSLILVNVRENGNSFEAKNARVIMFNDSGEELWRFNGDNYVSGQVAGISPDNNYVLMSDLTPFGDRANATYLLDGNGNLLNKFDGITFSEVVFSTDSKTAVLGAGRSAIIDLPSGQILYRFGNVTSFDVASERKLIAVIVRNILSVSTYNGLPVFSYELGSDDMIVGNRSPFDPIMSNPAVQISDDGSEIFISLAKRTVRFRLQ